MKILLVDDEPDVCKLIKTMIEPLGVEVRTSTDSQEAALILANEKFDGIMLDVAMPKMDGIELTRKIRSTPPNQQAPIIMITGLDDVDTIRRAFEAGATFFIGKPFSREKIYAIMRTARGAMMAERRRCARVPHRASVTCIRGGERFNATSISIGEGGIALESSGTVQVDEVIELEFNLPDSKKPVKVTGKIRVKEASGRTSIEFTDPSDAGRDAIREYVHGKVTE
jgi:CheY-like chemotaxis protein